jgi:hypothetical protein
MAPRLEHQAVVVLDRRQAIYELEVVQVVNGGEVYQVVESEAGTLIEKTTDVENRFALDEDRRVGLVDYDSRKLLPYSPRYFRAYQ